MTRLPPRSRVTFAMATQTLEAAHCGHGDFTDRFYGTFQKRTMDMRTTTVTAWANEQHAPRQWITRWWKVTGLMELDTERRGCRVADIWLVPASVEHFPLEGRRARLSVLWSNGQRAKLEGSADAMREAQSILLQAMTEQATVNVAQWPDMKIGSGREWNW